MPPVRPIKLSIEDKIGIVEDKKDEEVLKNIVEKLPSASKIRIHKRLEDGGKAFIISMSAEDFDVSNAQEYIKAKFSEKHGGGDYLIEMVDGGGDVVGKNVITLIEEKTKGDSDDKHIRLMNQALTMKEEAVDKVLQAKDALHDAEKTKTNSMMELMSKQFESIAEMYKSKIDDLTKKKEQSPEFMQIIYQGQIESMKREMEYEKQRMSNELNAKRESGAASDKMFELINTLIPTILANSQNKNEDPVKTMQNTITMLETVTGKKKDTLEELITNPEKMMVFQRLLGVDTQPRPDFFEEMLSNPMKAEMFKKTLGIEEKKDFFSELIENQNKMMIFKKAMGVEDAPPPIVVAPEPKKDLFEQMIDMSNKFNNAKPLLMNLMGIQPQPAKTFMELISTIVTGLGPTVTQAVNQITNSMVTVEMIRKGMVKQLPNGQLVAVESTTGFSGVEAQSKKAEKPPVVKESPKPIVKENNSMDIKRLFEEIVIDIVASSSEQIEGNIFVDKVSDNVVKRAKENPSLVNDIVAIPDIDTQIASVLSKVVGISEVDAHRVAIAIKNSTISKFLQPPKIN